MKNSRHNQVIIWICITSFTIQLGCAHLPQCPTEQVRTNLGAIGIVLVGTPEVRIDIPSKRRSKEADRMFGGTPMGPGPSSGNPCLDIACLSLVFLVVFVVGIFMKISATVDRAKEAKAKEAATRSAVAKLNIQEMIRDHLFLVAQEETSHDFKLINLQGLPEPGEADSYDFLEGKGIDTVLEIRVQNIRMKEKKAGSYPPIVFFLDVHTRLVRLVGGEELYTRTFHHRRPLTYWNDEKFESSCKILAESIVEEMFLLAELPLGSRWEDTRALRPKYPELSYNFGGGLKYLEVASLQPELQWEAFPRPEDREADDTGVLSRITDGTYDLKIWKADVNDLPGKLVYARKGLTASSHKIETPLLPLTNYFWNIRLRFKMDGYTRVSHWALSDGKFQILPCSWEY